MTPPSTLQIKLLSDTTFGRGEGTAGAVDIEVEHDDAGIPFIGGKTIRGLLRDTWLSMGSLFPELVPAAKRVLGCSQTMDEVGRLRIGDALAPEKVRDAIGAAVQRKEKPLPPDTILEAFTAIRYQTAENRRTGAPARTTLRSSRVVLRGFVFTAPLIWLDAYEPNADDRRCLALCVLATRHAGLLRNRGRGFVEMSLNGNVAATRADLDVAVAMEPSQ